MTREELIKTVKPNEEQRQFLEDLLETIDISDLSSRPDQASPEEVPEHFLEQFNHIYALLVHANRDLRDLCAEILHWEEYVEEMWEPEEEPEETE